MKASKYKYKWGSQYGTTKYALDSHVIYAMPYPRRNFIILYYSKFVILMLFCENGGMGELRGPLLL